MNFDGLRVGGVELVFKKLPISGIWGYPVPNSRARGHLSSRSAEWMASDRRRVEVRKGLAERTRRQRSHLR